MTFLWLKAFHLIAMVCWFAGIFYLPRLFVYHAMTDDQTSHERFVVMERKLYRGIMTPSAVVTVVLGLWMIAMNPDYYFAALWMRAKLVLVVFLIAYHLTCHFHMRQFATGNNRKSHVYFRFFNEVPVILLIAIVLLAVLKPF
jgi:putative membrane protein